MRDGFVFYRSFAEALTDIDDKTFRQVMDAVMWYALDDREPELTGIPNAIFKLIKPQIDANTRRYENGKKGGRPKKTEEIYGTVKQTPKKGIKTAQKANHVDGWFEEFWKAYPRKVAKPTARQKFITKCRNEETFRAIMAGLELHKKTWNDPQYIPHPSTWLNQERWNDAPTNTSSGVISISVPDYIIKQEAGIYEESGEATQEEIDQVKKWQEMMEV